MENVSAEVQAAEAAFLASVETAPVPEEVEAFLAAIDDNDDVQQVFVGLAG